MEPQRSPYGIGIDPGWVSLGAAVVKTTDVPFKFIVEAAHTFDPSSYSLLHNGIQFIAQSLWSKIPGRGHDNSSLVPVSIERYVSYGNVRSTHTEEILMVIGRLCQVYDGYHATELVYMHKAIDWKTKLCKALVRYARFDNPSSSLDKKFSIAAAKFISINPETTTNDHEADSILLAAFPHIMAQAHAALASRGK